MKNTIQLQMSSILRVPFDKYEKDFKFIVNNETFETNRLIADLLSPKISKLHYIDPTVKEYTINTKNKGDFSNILQLIQFNSLTVTTDIIPFLIEVIEKLGNNSQTIKHQFEFTKQEKTLQNTIDELIEHTKYPNFYEKEIEDEINEISHNFSEVNEEDKEKLQTLDYDLISKIIFNSKLQIESEDELFEFVNSIYKKNREYSNLYSSVIFKNVSIEKMKEFVSLIDVDDITTETWMSLSSRLCSELEEKNIKNETRYKNKTGRGKKSTKIINYENNPFKGIINSLQQETNIKDEINITWSSNSLKNEWEIFIYDKENDHFHTNGNQDEWICIKFKQHEIIPTHYTIKSGTDSDNLKTFVLEGSKDKNAWEILDEQNNISYLDVKRSVHTFPIQKQPKEPIKYLRIRPGPKCGNRYMVQFCCIEFFGKLF